jgi:tetratricopeptide (TPR) repeat protein
MTLATLGAWIFKISLALWLTAMYLTWSAKRQARNANTALERIKAHIRAGDLTKARQAFDAMKRYKGMEYGRIIYATAAVNLVSAYNEKDKVDQAQAVFDVVKRLRKSREIQIKQASAACLLVETYCKMDSLAQAQKIFDAMPDFGTSEEVQCFQASAADALIRAYGEKNIEAAQAAFDAISNLGISGNMQVIRAAASLYLACLYGIKGALDKARALFDAAKKITTTNVAFVERRAVAAGILVYCYREKGNLEEARKIFSIIQGIGKSERILVTCARAAVDLIQAYGMAGNLVQAQEIFDAMPPHANSKELRCLRAKASAMMVYAYGVIGQSVQRKAEPANEPDLPRAQAIFDAMQTLGNSPDIIQLRFAATACLVAAYGQFGKDVARAQACFDSLADFGDTEGIRLERAQASITMINAYGAKGRFHALAKLDTNPMIPISDYGEDQPLRKSRAIYDAMPALGDTEAFRVLRAHAADSLITDYCHTGQIDEAIALCETIKKLGQDAEIQTALASGLFKLSQACARAQDIAKAREIFLALKALPATEKIREYRDMSAHGLIHIYRIQNNSDEVRWMLAAIADMGDSSQLQSARIRGNFHPGKDQEAVVLKNQEQP